MRKPVKLTIRRTLLVTFAAFLPLTGGCAAFTGGSAERETVPYEMTQWRYEGSDGRLLTTAHYEIYTTLQDEFLLSTFPQLMERAFEHYQQIVPPGRQPDEKMKVYLFSTRAEWAEFTRRLAGPKASQLLQIRNGGYSERGVTVIQYASHQTTFPLMLHEGFHQYAQHYASSPIPPWLNEGLAVTCEGIIWRGMNIEGFDPWANPLRRNTLAEALLHERTLPLAELLKTHAGRIVARGDRATRAYYGQVWALVLFLREGLDEEENAKYAADYQRMINAIASGESEQQARAAHIWSEHEAFNPGEALFRAYITEDIEAFEQEYIAFMRQKVLGERPPEAG